MTLDQAEAEVLGWAIPEVERRIEYSAYVSDGALGQILGTTLHLYDDNGLSFLVLSEDDDAVHKLDERLISLAVLPTGYALIAVEASEARMRLLEHDGPDGRLGTDTEGIARGGDVVTAGDRRHIWAVFDAATGASLGAVDLAPTGPVAPLSAVPTLSADQMRPATRVPMPTTEAVIWDPATPTPLTEVSHQRVLKPGEVPQQVAATAARLPIVAGAWWRYRTTGLQDDVYWKSSETTVTVVESVQIAPDAVRSTVRVDPPEGKVGDVGFFSSYEPHYYLLPNALIGRVQSNPTLQELRDYAAQVARAPANPERVAQPPAQDIFLSTWRTGDDPNYWWHLADLRGIDTPAGTFQDCAVFERIFGMRVTAAIWLCPGVGFVRAEIPVLGSMTSNWIGVHELVEFHIPEQVLVP